MKEAVRFVTVHLLDAMLLIALACSGCLELLISIEAKLRYSITATTISILSKLCYDI